MMILSVTLSKPCGNVCEKLSKPYEKIKISIENASGSISYFVQLFTKTQVFHEHWDCLKLESFLDENVGITFKNCVKRTENEEITILTNKKGKQTELHKNINSEKKNQSIKENELFYGNPNGKFFADSKSHSDSNEKLQFLPEKKKNYILQEGKPVPFLVTLGIMNAEGKVFNAKYDKFRQINRFLEFIDDAVNDVLKIYQKNKNKNHSVLKICDFGCGKSYLTFAIHYFLTQIKNIPCQIEGLDLKSDVIKYCNDLAEKLDLKGLKFKVGNIADYSGQEPDIVVTLHACDTATDFALKYAVDHNAKVILSVPCCQHQVNSQLSKKTQKTENIDLENKNPQERLIKAFHDEIDEIFEPLLKWGLIRDKFASLVTDSLRGKWLEKAGYKVDMLEFIDESHTPKNLLIRAVKSAEKSRKKDKIDFPKLIPSLQISPEIWK